MNIAQRAGRWSAGHWKTATIGWLALVISALIAGHLAGTVNLTDAQQATGQSARAQTMLTRAGFRDHATETVLVQSHRETAAAASFRAEIRRVVVRVERFRQVASLRSPLSPGNGGLISADGHSALVEFDMTGSADTAPDRVQPILDAVAGLQRDASGFTVAESGDASGARGAQASIDSGLARAEELSVPITFVILLVAFGAVLAAFVPVLLAFSAVLAAGGLAAVASHVVPAADTTSSVMLLMGMAVGVDYSLFYVKREREERRRGLAHGAALEAAAATSGRAVLVSGITVLIAMAGMLFTGSAVFDSIAVGAMLVVLTALLGSLTVLPALLGRLGDRVDRGRIRRVRSTSRVWGAVLRPVLRFPLAAALLSTALLVVLSAPTLRLHTTLTDTGDLPHTIPAVRTYEEIQRAFPGAPSPAAVAVHAPELSSGRGRAAIAAFERMALASRQAKQPIQVTWSRDGQTAEIDVPLVGSGSDGASMRALATLRAQVLPATIGRLPAARYAVTGETAGTHDFNALIRRHFPIVFAFVLGLAFALLLLAFRSVTIPVMSIALNLLSVGAAYGVLVWIFQEGHLQRLLGFHSNGAVVTWLPLFLFVVLFGLSMDYHVFIVSRIKELHDRGASTSQAVLEGIGSSAGTTTAAAAVMVAVFAIFAWLPTLDIKQMGVGLAIAVLLDATLIRAVLLPATMKILGEWNWYLPSSLGWLPAARREGPPRAGAAEVA